MSLQTDYNTRRKKMVLPEYGRNIQKMVDDMNAIEGRDNRNQAAQVIISIMGNMNPHLRDVPDFKHKLWDHLFIMSDFDLDIDSPYPIPVRETFQEKPRKLVYPAQQIKFMHYGKTLENMVIKAIEFEEGPEKVHLIEILANHMKKSYLLWNRDSVSDETIFNNLNVLSKGRLKPAEDLKLVETKEVLGPKIKKKKPPKNHKGDYRSRN